MQPRAFPLVDFRRQMERIVRPTHWDRFQGWLFGCDVFTPQQRERQQEEVRRLFGMIDAITPDERQRPESIDRARAQRIARGSGVRPREVRELVRQFFAAKQVMKQIHNRRFDN